MSSGLLVTLLFFSAVVAALLAYVVLSSRHAKASRGALAPVGRVGTIERELKPAGFVLVAGELWRARLRDERGCAPKGAKVRVVGAEGCDLLVEPLV
jgi:membrane protein implicated in regulation of membrane protease activity